MTTHFNPADIILAQLTFSACLSVAAVRPVTNAFQIVHLAHLMYLSDPGINWSLKPFQVKRYPDQSLDL